MISPTLGVRLDRKGDQVIVFGGHGSSTIFSSKASRQAQDDVQQSLAAAIFLSKCQAAFLEDCLDIGHDSRQMLGIGSDKFEHLKDLLIPSERLWQNPIIQAVTICLYQLLRFIAEVERPTSTLRASGKQLLESVGVCSGLLPAAVAATSGTINDIII